MSIIHEALKKVEVSGIRKEQQDPSQQKKKLDLKAYLLYLLVAILGFVVANLIFSFMTKAVQKPAKPAIKVPLIKALPSPTPSPALPVEKEEKAAELLKLNGIFFSGSDGYALINNQIVKAGDELAGAVVLRITLDGVELKRGDKTINLYNQSK